MQDTMRVEDAAWSAQTVGNVSTVSLLLVSIFLTRNARSQAAFCIPFDPGMPSEKGKIWTLKPDVIDKTEKGDEPLAFPAVPSSQHGNNTEADKLRYTIFNDAWQQVHDHVLVSPSTQHTIFGALTDGL